MPYKKGYSIKKRFVRKKIEQDQENTATGTVLDVNKENNEPDKYNQSHAPFASTCGYTSTSNANTEDNTRCQPLAEPINKNPSTSLKDLAYTLKLVGLPFGWTLVESDDTQLKVVYMKERKRSPMKDPMILKSITVYADLTWILRVHDKPVQQFDSKGLENLIKHKEIKTNEGFFEILTTIDEAKICCGNPDNDLMDTTERSTMIGTIAGNTNSTMEANFEVRNNGQYFDGTIRAKKCHLLVSGRYDRCAECVKHRNYLRVIKSRQTKLLDDDKRYTESGSHVNYRYLSSEGKTERLRSMQKKLKSTKQVLRKTRSKVDHLINTEGHVLDSEMNDYLAGILRDKDFANELPEGSFRRLFWEQQLQALCCNDSRQRRWHPIMIKWCLNVKLRSTSAYKAMRDSGVIQLPSERTLRDYTHWTKVTSGFQPSSFERLLLDMKYSDLDDWQKFVVLLHDEVKIKSDLVYCKHTGELVGFANLGEMNNALTDFEKQCQDDSNSTPDIATYMLVFMVRGITIKLEYPLAHFPCNGCITADLLFPLVWDAVRHLETIGLKVAASTCDGASTNRKFIKIHKPPKSARGLVVHKTRNIYSSDKRDLFFISDAPHLLKTVRNNWENSGWNKKTRQLWNGGHSISWLHLVNLYKDDLRRGGLKLVPKLKYDHIYLTSYSRMKVHLATQVLSTTVANALDSFYGQDVRGTVKFIRMFDKFFDCMNTRSLTEATRNRKPDLAPYKSPSDARLKWLKEDFLMYLQNWSNTVDQILYLDAKQKARMMLSHQTIEGIHMTVNSFVELTKFLLAQTGVRFVLSERFNQDPLESHFGKQRQMKGGNDNPTVAQFNYNENSIRLLGSQVLAPASGNCKRSTPSEDTGKIDGTPLPKRQRRPKQLTFL